MQPITATVGADGRVAIPGTRAGQTVTIFFEPKRIQDATPDPIAAAEQARIIDLLVKGGKRVRQKTAPEILAGDHGEWLYDPDGLPQWSLIPRPSLPWCLVKLTRIES